MFNLFRNNKMFNSQEEKLEYYIYKKIETMAFRILKESGMKNTVIAGIILTGAIADAKNYCLSTSISLSNEYNLSEEKTI